MRRVGWGEQQITQQMKHAFKQNGQMEQRVNAKVVSERTSAAILLIQMCVIV
jgi:hypothetical protein